MEIEIKLGIFVSVFHFHTTMINFVFCKNCFYACIHQSRCRRVCCSLEDYHRKVLMHTTIYICTLYPIEPPHPPKKTPKQKKDQNNKKEKKTLVGKSPFLKKKKKRDMRDYLMLSLTSLSNDLYVEIHAYIITINITP